VFAALFAVLLGGESATGRMLVGGAMVLAWSRDEGQPCVATDWRATNLMSSRTWPALGSRPTYLRLHRLLGE
jgi:hypothetical protein